MITHEDALKLFLDVAPIAETESLFIDEALGRRLAKDIMSPCNLPLFSNSAMDGVALRMSQMSSEVVIQGTRLAKAVDVAGVAIDKLDDPSTVSIRIMTGAKVPPWAEVVVPIENVEVNKNTSGQEVIRILKNTSFKVGDNIRYAGEDYKKGELIYGKDKVLTPEALMVLASFGIRHVEVFKIPQFWMATTGDEVKEVGTTLHDGEIYNTSSIYLKSNLKALSYSFHRTLHLNDHRLMIGDFLKDWLKTKGPSFLVTTGAVSMGEKDDLPILAKELGLKIHFHKISIRPGKPILFASHKNHFWIGAPGNAVSTAVAWTYFIRPFLHQWMRVPLPVTIQAPLACDVIKPKNLKAFFRGNFDGKQVLIHKDQGSQRMKPTAMSNVFVELPLDQTAIPKGTLVKCTVWDLS